MKRRIITFCITLLLALTLITPVFAEVSATDMRHSVVRIEVGCNGDAGFFWLSGGTGFFIGEKDKNPEYLVTNYHVIDTFIQLGKGTEQADAFGAFCYWYLINVQGLTETQISNMDQETLESILSSIYSQLWVKFAGSSTSASFRSMIRVYYDDNDYDEAYLTDYGDWTKDMALLRLNKPTDKRVPIAISEPTENMVNQKVTAIGYPGASGSVFDPVSDKGENDSTVTGGTVSRLQTESGTGLRVVQYDASINHGNSGGPLILNENGAVIAINTWGNGDDSNMFFGVSMSEVVQMLKKNNVAYVDAGDPFAAAKTTTTSSTETSTTTTTTASTTAPDTKSKGLPLTQVILGIIALAAILAAVLFFGKRSKTKNNKEDSYAGVSNKTDAENDRPTVIEKNQRRPEPVPAGDPEDSLFRIQCISGSLADKRIMIPKTGQIIMGRDEKCGIRFPSGTNGVSRRHCAVYYDSGTVYIKDIGSTYGTFVDPGKKLAANEVYRLAEGQKFWIGSENECFIIERKK